MGGWSQSLAPHRSSPRPLTIIERLRTNRQFSHPPRIYPQRFHRFSVSPRTPLFNTFLRRRSLLSLEKPKPQIRISVIVMKLDLRQVGGYNQALGKISDMNTVTRYAHNRITIDHTRLRIIPLHKFIFNGIWVRHSFSWLPSLRENISCDSQSNSFRLVSVSKLGTAEKLKTI